MTFFANFISYSEPLIVWSHVTLTLIRKPKLGEDGGEGGGGDYIEEQHLQDRKLLKIVWPVRKGNAYIVIIYLFITFITEQYIKRTSCCI